MRDRLRRLWTGEAAISGWRGALGGLVLGGALVSLAPGEAAAQRRMPAPAASSGEDTPQRARGARDEGLRGLLGDQAARALIRGRDRERQLRGIERLGAIGTPEAIEALVDELDRVSSLDPSAPLADPRPRLEAVRALAPHARRSGVRDLLVRFVSEGGPGAASPLGAQVRGAAALALARSGDPKAISALVAATEKGGSAGEAAGLALHAHPPALLEAALEGRKLSAPLVRWLGAHGDLRALPRLEKALAASKLASIQMELARALAALGSEAPAAMARGWLAKSDPALRIAGGEVLAALAHRDAPAAIAGLLGDDATRSAGVRLAMRSPAPALVAPLEAAAGRLDGEAAARAVSAIGRAGGPPAAAALTRLLASPELSTAAAHALARMPGPAAAAALDAALRSAKAGAARRLVVRAGVLRALSLGRASAAASPGERERFEAALAALRRSKDPADRAAAAFGDVSLGLREPGEVLAACASGARDACPPGIAGAAARGALALGPEALSAFGGLLERAAASGAGELAVAAGVYLLAEPSGGELSTRALASWAEGGGALSPLAARALPSRDDDVTRGRIKALLSGGDPVVRAHVALGLARDPEPDAVHLLVRAYRFEARAEVRRAIVRALSRRKEPQRRRTLELARDLDPDARVRVLARSALEGRVLDHVSPAERGGEPARPGPRTLWISILPNAPPEEGEAPPPGAARLVRPDGLAVPVVADPDGVMLIPGLPDGESVLQLAAPPESQAR